VVVVPGGRVLADKVSYLGDGGHMYVCVSDIALTSFGEELERT